MRRTINMTEKNVKQLNEQEVEQVIGGAGRRRDR